MEGSEHQHRDYGRNQPVFEEATSPLYYSNDGRMQIEKATDGFAILDATKKDVEMFTHQRVIADAFIAGYDYAERLSREA